MGYQETLLYVDTATSRVILKDNILIMFFQKVHLLCVEIRMLKNALILNVKVMNRSLNLESARFVEKA